MTILVVDDQAEDLESTADLVRTLQPDEELLCFDNGFAALAEARNKEQCDLMTEKIDFSNTRYITIDEEIIVGSII